MHGTRCRLALTSFLSDVEGSTHYFKKFLDISRVVYRCPTTGKLRLRGDDTRFVFGGDAFDKSGDDIAFAADLLQLKKDFPDRVVLIAGNRDVNKSVFSSFYTDAYLAQFKRPGDVPVPFFMAHSTTATSYEKYLCMAAERDSSIDATKVTRETFLQWNLSHTMGCSGLFEKRRAYLGSLKGTGAVAVSDAEVCNSFLSAAAPQGIYREYLPLTQLAAVVDNTLFVHGAITTDNFGVVPSKNVDEKVNDSIESINVVERGGSVQEWVDALNAFCKSGWDDWIESPTFNAATGRRGGHYLAAYCHRKAIAMKTVAVLSFTDEVARNGPKFVDLRIVEHCNNSGIFRVCAGHKPVGDTPLIIQQPGLCTIVADNSYCGKESSVDFRDEAVQEVLLDGAAGTALVHGKRCDGSSFEFDPENPILGIPVGDGWWSKAILSSGNVLLHRTSNDYFSNEYLELPQQEVEESQSKNPLSSVCDGDFFERYRKSDLKPMKSKVKPLPH